MVESRGGRATETKRAFGNTNSPGDAENSSCSPIPYERDNCCACNTGPTLCNRSFGLAPAVAETFPQHRQRGCSFSLMQTRRKSWGQGSPGGNGVFSLSKQLPFSEVFFTLSCFLSHRSTEQCNCCRAWTRMSTVYKEPVDCTEVRWMSCVFFIFEIFSVINEFPVLGFHCFPDLPVRLPLIF